MQISFVFYLLFYLCLLFMMYILHIFKNGIFLGGSRTRAISRSGGQWNDGVTIKDGKRKKWFGTMDELNQNI